MHNGHDHEAGPDGVVDIGTPESRNEFIVSEVARTLGHHDTLADALACTLGAVLHGILVELMTSAAGGPGFANPVMIDTYAQHVVSNGTVNINLVLLAADVAALHQMCVDGRPLPEDIATLAAGR